MWKNFWLLFTVIWVVVAALNVVTILAFGDQTPAEKAFQPLILAFVVPAVLYAVGWAWERVKKKPR
jgi:hypothetical protein